jgi:hypothetical protein
MMYGAINPATNCSNKKMPTVRPVVTGDFMESCTAESNAEFPGRRQETEIEN